MNTTDTTTSRERGITGNTFHLELCEGQTLTREDIDMILLCTNKLIRRVHVLGKKLNKENG